MNQQILSFVMIKTKIRSVDELWPCSLLIKFNVSVLKLNWIKFVCFAKVFVYVKSQKINDFPVLNYDCFSCSLRFKKLATVSVFETLFLANIQRILLIAASTMH